MNVRRPPSVVMIAPRIGAGPDGRKLVPTLGVGDHPSAAIEIRIKRSVMLVELVTVSPSGIGLPYLRQGAAHGTPIFIQNLPAYDDSLSGGRACVLCGQVTIACRDCGMSKNRSSSLGKSA